MQLNAAEIATGRWHGILLSLGIDGAFLRNKHGPCPLCGGHDRFRFDDKQGRGTYFCSKCGSGDGYSLLQKFHGWGFKQALNEVRRQVGFVEASPVKPQDDEAKKIANIKRVVTESLAVTVGDPVWLYLNTRLGLEIVPASLRYHPALAYYTDDGEISYHPAMLAIVTDANSAGVTVHRTYLTEAGKKANVECVKKLMPGKPLQGACVRLGGHDGTLGIAEGIETALAASMRFGLPVWSCISATIMESWKAPEGVERVIVFGDHDASYAGQAAAYRVAHKLAVAGISVEVRIPERNGTDWADA